VLAAAELAGFCAVSVWVALSGDALPGMADLAWAAGAGIAGAIGLGALYRGMAVGAMGVVAPISAISPVVPLAVDLSHGDAPSELQLVGIAAALGGVVLVSREPETGGATARGVGLALLAALGFGVYFVGLDASADASVAWAVGVSRGAATMLAAAAAVAVGAALRPPAVALPALALIGIFDVGANVLVGLATTRGLVGVVAVLSALYPLVTVALARAFLRERIGPAQRAGAGAALAGAALIAAG
jgi:drug/metabolite transporter (DMT)-like permease